MGASESNTLVILAHLIIYIYKTEMPVHLFVCLSVHHVWRGKGRGAAEGDVEGGQNGEGQWGGGISMMECQGSHTFPKQLRVTQVVVNIRDHMLYKITS